MLRARTRSGPVAICLAFLLACGAWPALAGEAGKTPQRITQAELLGLALLNCTRTGGWVRADGSCRIRELAVGASPAPALVLHKGISSKVAFRWAGELVKASVCDHVIPGKPVLSSRFKSAGFNYPYFGENVGCGWGGSVEQMVIATHRSMQAEKGTRGWHWRNINNPQFKSVGIGVATLGRQVAIVYDFYGR